MPKFRYWLRNMWMQNCEEKNLYKDGPKYSLEEYWKTYRIWLLAEYRKQRQLIKEQNELRQRHARWTN